MITITGVVSELKMIESKSDDGKYAIYCTSFLLGNKKVEIETSNEISVKEGDKAIVAGMEINKSIFRAYSYKCLINNSLV